MSEQKRWYETATPSGGVHVHIEPTTRRLSPTDAAKETVRVPAVTRHPEDVRTIDLFTAVAWSIAGMLLASTIGVWIWAWSQEVRL